MLNAQLPSHSTLQGWIVTYVASVLDLEPDSVALDQSFHDIGMDSAEVVIMTGVLEEEFAIEVRAELPFEHPTINGFVAALIENRPASA